MADWQRFVRLNPEWSQAKDGKIPMHELAESIAKKLRAVQRFGIPCIDGELEDIIDEFEYAAGDDTTTGDDIDYIMSSLYDWADQSLDLRPMGRKVCWVDTVTY